jgi:nitroimidazol reductase NimA-like FMN-containing flavoprotein (pyridoxamine 5'-phosphate oxidase superfamily)
MAHENQLKMSSAEVLALVRSEGFLVLGTLEAEQPPAAETVACDIEGNSVIISVVINSRSHRNVQEDPRVCAIVENAERDFYRMRSAMIHGSLAFVADDPEREVAQYVLELDDVISFDFSKIREKH